MFRIRTPFHKPQGFSAGSFPRQATRWDGGMAGIPPRPHTAMAVYMRRAISALLLGLAGCAWTQVELALLNCFAMLCFAIRCFALLCVALLCFPLLCLLPVCIRMHPSDAYV